MSDPVFYVGSQANNSRLTGYVPAKFLVRNGMYVMDPMPGGSQKAYLYSDGSGTDKTDGSVANPYNFLMVPRNYTEQQARDFAAQVASAAYPEDEMGATGLHQALGQMMGAFWPGGSQDLQRHPQWGVPKGSMVPAFVGSASNHLGYVTGLAGLPMQWPEIVGGPLNALHRFFRPEINTDGPYWLSRQNHANILQGFNDGVAAGQPPAPFNDYGYGTQPQRSSGQIGDGNGIAGWTSSLAGVDPEEPPPPAWPPATDRPIRYLGKIIR